MSLIELSRTAKKSFFRIGMWNSRPPPFREKTILNFHFDYLNTPLKKTMKTFRYSELEISNHFHSNFAFKINWDIERRQLNILFLFKHTVFILFQMISTMYCKSKTGHTLHRKHCATFWLLLTCAISALQRSWSRFHFIHLIVLIKPRLKKTTRAYFVQAQELGIWSRSLLCILIEI